MIRRLPLPRLEDIVVNAKRAPGIFTRPLHKLPEALYTDTFHSKTGSTAQSMDSRIGWIDGGISSFDRRFGYTIWTTFPQSLSGPVALD
mmetsp:Transcript_17245/g.32710  ORF Transcript_17245/g.32710 Transcript_17245/m.32710 type:complete len:89 (-) Transcript_17245:173-439(-)